MGTKSRVPSTEISGFHSLKCRLPGILPLRNDITVLISPARPETDSVCPILVFTEPTAHGLSPGP
ncbi:Uncharacterised protein [Mycobacteroides abscessus subsp. abscessus]|nr:Uncharacterised protein [Mycobacteroides abscessus subsp. abscessus]